MTRQAPALVLACAAACVAASSATADTIAAKQAEAQRVIGQIQQLGSSMERARNAYDVATVQLHAIDRNLAVNRVGLRAARVNLKRSQRALAQRLVVIYTSRDEQSTLSVLLGAQSLDDLVNRIETVNSVSSQDVAVMRQVIGFKHEVAARQTFLVRAHIAQRKLVAVRAAAKAHIAAQLGAQQRLLGSIKGEIARIISQQRARQLYLAHAAQTRLSQYQEQQNLKLLGTVVGASGVTPDGSVAPPSPYSGVVGIAMHYLGTPYVWGGSGPGGFDCSGLVMYVYSQVGISLPHYTGAQWNAGVHVARSDLQPGDLVFFDGLGHVGIYIGGGQFIHAPQTGDVVKISNLNEGWYAGTYDGAVRITG